MGGHGGIGHIDVFADDLRAENWYRRKSAPDKPVSGARSPLWRMLKHEVLDENIDFDPQLIEETLGPTPSVGGMIPKLLVSIDKITIKQHKPRFFPPRHPLEKDNKRTDVILKIEPPEYRGLLDLEALCLDLHREAGFETPEHQRYSHDELEFLAVERFDRQPDDANKPVPMESLFSVIASGNHQFWETGDILLDELGGYLRQLNQIAKLPDNTAEQLYCRFVMALLTGNGDLHLENLSLLGGLFDCRLSPIYDPAPMRAWPRHNIISAIPFDHDPFKNHAHFYIHLGQTFDLSLETTRFCIEKILDDTASYVERVMSLQRVPLKQRKQLSDIVIQERKLIRKALQKKSSSMKK